MPRAINGTTQRITTNAVASTNTTTALNQPVGNVGRDKSGNAAVHEGSIDAPYSGPKAYLISALTSEVVVKFGDSTVALASSSDGMLVHPNDPRLINVPTGTTHVAHMSGGTNVGFQIEQVSRYSEDD